MRPFLQSPRLTFSRDGRALVAVNDDGVTVTDIRTGASVWIEARGATAAIGFADQVWIAAERMLYRHGFDGRALASPMSLPAEPGMLVVVPVGPVACVWMTSQPISLVEEQGVIQSIVGPAAELAIPLTARRWVTANGARVVAPSGLSCELPAGSRVIGGAVIFEGTAAALVTERTSRELVLVGLANGRIKLRHPIPGGALRAAARRGLVAILAEPRRIAVVDLRAGRVIGEVATAFDVVDFAIDPDGQWIALRDEHSIEQRRLRDAFGTAATRAGSGEAASEDPKPIELPSEPVVVAEVPVPIAIDPIVPVTTPVRFTRPLDLHTLAPRPSITPAPLAVALELLDHDIRRVALWTLGAITEAWDSRRIGYGNEGRHPFEHEVAALLGMNRGFAAEHLAAAREHVAEHEDLLATIPDRRCTATPLGELAAELGLSDLALDILIVVAARPRSTGQAQRTIRGARSSTRRSSNRSSARGFRVTHSPPSSDRPRRCNASASSSPMAAARVRSPGWRSIRSCSRGFAARCRILDPGSRRAAPIVRSRS